jgi:hypothetical protein
MSDHTIRYIELSDGTVIVVAEQLECVISAPTAATTGWAC